MILFRLFLLLNLLSLSGICQEIQIVKEISESAETFKIDKLGNIYFIAENKLIKYSYDSYERNEYYNSSITRINNLDVSNPFRLLIFDKDNNTVIFLNNILSEISEALQMDELGIYETKSVCQSVNSGLWILDSYDLKLKYFDHNKMMKMESSSLDDLCGNCLQENLNFEERNSTLYLHIPSKGVLIFDQYGVFEKQLPLPEIKTCEIFDDKIGYYISPNYYFYDLVNYQTERINIPVSGDIIDCIVTQDRIYAYTGEKLSIFTIKD